MFCAFVHTRMTNDFLHFKYILYKRREQVETNDNLSSSSIHTQCIDTYMMMVRKIYIYVYISNIWTRGSSLYPCAGCENTKFFNYNHKPIYLST